MALRKLGSYLFGFAAALSILAGSMTTAKAADTTTVDAVTAATTVTSSESDTEIAENTVASNSETAAIDLANGQYTVDFKVLKENTDDVSNAGNYFTSTGAIFTVKDGVGTLRLEYSNEMIGNLQQIVNEEHKVLDVVEVNGTKYVEVTFYSLEEIAKLYMEINTGTAYGVMKHVVRISLDQESIQEVKEVALADGVYTVPLTVYNEAGTAASMMNQVLAGDAIVTVKDGKSTIKVSFTGLAFGGKTGHLLKLWAYPGTNLSEYTEDDLTEAVVTKTVKETGITGEVGTYPYTFELSRNAIAEEAFHVQVNVDAMGSAKINAKFVFDYENAKSAVPVKSITLNKSTATLTEGKKVTLTATVKPASATEKDLVWTSSDKSVATVSRTGVVTAKKPGTVTITATAADGSGVKTSCKVTVGYSITYVLNGGTNSSKNPTSYYKTAVTLAKPTREGYTFVGWYTNKSLTNKITSIKKSAEKNYTVYAKWKKVTVGKASVASASSKTSKQLSLKLNEVTNASGYQIVISTSKNFTSSTTSKSTITGVKTTLTGLKKNKTYYVKVRAFQKDSTGKKVYGSYSKVVTVKVK